MRFAAFDPLTLARGVRCAAPLLTSRRGGLGDLTWLASRLLLVRHGHSQREWSSGASHHPPRTLKLDEMVRDG